MEDVLKLLTQNARLTNSEMAVLLGKEESEVARIVEKLQEDGVIKGYQAIINYEKLPHIPVFALIECKVMPKAEYGFQEIADRVMALEEVDSVYLMAGNYDLAVYVKGATMQEVANFVAKRLSTLESILSTSTRFVLQRYKQNGVILDDKDIRDPRNMVL
ncbi:MAG: Lrp/AsnC family transcriptional regulator [Erysipelotrichaceae bacterium]|nr:Lrp/AsnC family transcriptional regulator [Erysipelotrichaceae bacterium]MDP3305350.1 Lrp/AsnC family transcriptional regulator [Erysipelotrichaceae bacterium]